MNIPNIGSLLKWWYPQNTPKWSFLVGKPIVVGYHPFRKPPYRELIDPMGLKAVRFQSSTCWWLDGRRVGWRLGMGESIRKEVFRTFVDVDLGAYGYGLGGGFKYFLFSTLPGEMIHFDESFSNGLKPPTRYGMSIFRDHLSGFFM